MATEEPVWTYERTGFKFWVYRNRIEVQERGMIAWRSDTVLLRSITDVGVRLGGKLRLTLAGGEKPKEYTLGLKAEEAKQKIVEQL